MRTFDLKDAHGQLIAFEIDAAVGRRGVQRIVSRLPGVIVTRSPRLLSWWREQEFCEFDFEGVSFVAEEPFGDNSRYWIGAKPPRATPQIEIVKAVFLRS